MKKTKMKKRKVISYTDFEDQSVYRPLIPLKNKNKKFIFNNKEVNDNG